jgi:hypothetical protein
MCIEWIRSRCKEGMQSMDFWNRAKSFDEGSQERQAFVSRMRFFMTDQAFRIVHHPTDATARASDHLRTVGLRSLGTDLVFPGTPEEIASAVHKKGAQFTYVKYGMGGHGIHIVATGLSGGTLHYFDPNLGEVSMRKDDLQRWLKWIFGTRYKHVSFSTCAVESFARD